MKPYKPSRICPHRLCPPLHTALAVTGLLAAAQVMFASWLGWLFLVLAGLMSYATPRPVHRRTMMDRVMQDEMAQALGVHLEVRPVWAHPVPASQRRTSPTTAASPWVPLWFSSRSSRTRWPPSPASPSVPGCPPFCGASHEPRGCGGVGPHQRHARHLVGLSAEPGELHQGRG